MPKIGYGGFQSQWTGKKTFGGYAVLGFTISKPAEMGIEAP
jgi:hypothetical protein